MARLTRAQRQEEARVLEFSTLVDSVKDYAIFMLDPEGRVVTWNAGARRLKGYADDEVIGKHFSMFFPEPDVAQGRPQELLARAAEQPVEDQGWRVAKGGRRFWADAILSPVHDDDGELMGFIKVTRDLTDRRRVEDAIRDSEERLRLMVDSVKDYAIFMLDAAGRVTSWNAGAQRLKGYQPSEIIGQHFSRFYPSVEVASRRPDLQLQRAAAEGRAEDEGWRVRKDGTRFWASVVISAMYDENGTLRGFTKVTRDMTERRRASEELSRRADRQAAVAELGLFALRMRDVDPVLDEAITRTAGLLPAPLMWLALRTGGGDQLLLRAGQGFPAGVIGQVSLSASAGTMEQQVLSLGEPVLIDDLRTEARFTPAALFLGHGARSGVVVPVVSTEDQKPQGVLAAFSRELQQFSPADVSFLQAVANVVASAMARLRAERQLREAERATAEERERLVRAEEAIRGRDVFLTVAAHELRTPLTALQLKLEAIQRLVEREAGSSPQSGPPTVTAKLKERVAVAVGQTDRMAVLVERLLDVSRMAVGRLMLSPREMDLTALVAQVIADFREQAEEAGAKVTLHRQTPATGLWDPRRLEQVISNLLANALKYGKGEPVDIFIDDQAAPGRVRLTIRDRGIGIAAEDQSRLFELFERAAPVAHFGGLGIGLYITRRLVEAHGGSVSVTSELGSGSEFLVELPRRADAVLSQESSQP